MIRRDCTAEDGSPAWLLISQVEHARVAGELARDWGGPEVAPLPCSDVVLPTIYRHDDGWKTWERAPRVDPQHGRPCSFLEMPTEAAEAIWTASIEGVAQLGPLAQYLVAAHFVGLRQRAGSERDPFLQINQARIQRWLAAWQAEHPPENTPAVAAAAQAHLLWFDTLSLWLCCRRQPDVQTSSPPGGPTITFTPGNVRVHDGELQLSITAAPWPFSIDTVHVEATARRIPAVHYADDGQLHAALQTARPIRLVWQLDPPG